MSNKVIRQHDTRDCGAACLCMVARYFDKSYSIQFLRKLSHTSQDGVTIWGIVEAAEKIGLKGEAYSGDVNDLKEYMSQNSAPVMLHLKVNHFVVAYKKNTKFIYIKDPARGSYKIPWEHLDQIWSGYLIGFSKTPNDDRLTECEDGKNKYSLLGKIIKANIKTLVCVFLISLVVFGVVICSNYMFQILIDHGGTMTEAAKEAGHHHHEDENIFIHILETIAGNSMYLFLACMIALYLLMAVIMLIRGKMVAVMSRNIDISLADQYVKKIESASLREIGSRKLGEYLTRISDLVSLRRVISDLLVASCLDLVMIILSVIILVRMNRILFLIALIGVVLYVLVALVLRNRIQVTNYEIMNDNAEMQSFFKEFLQGIEIIKMNNACDVMEETFINKYTKYVNSIYRGNMIGVASGTLSALIEQISSIVIVVLGFVFVDAQVFSLGELLSFYMFLTCMTEPIKDILSFQTTIQAGIVSLNRLEDIRYMEDEKSGDELLDEKEMRIDLENVHFHYPGKQDLLKDVSLHVSGTDKVVIQGANGSGKSTLLKLIMGIEEPDSGLIKINGVEIDQIEKANLRNRIGYVTQDNFLFAETIKNNITLNKDIYSEEDFEMACKLAGVDSVVEQMPMKYDTFINEDGGNLSMGQRQAIAIARALIRKPGVLILDEATSNMDEEREKQVMQNVLRLNIPCIVISHSKNVVELFEKKIQLSN